VAEDRAPYSWVGLRVEVSILQESYGDGQWTLTARDRTGTLEAVTFLGIVASLSDSEDDDEPSASTFYPWSSVIWMRPSEGE
jgi:hypothetical protein